MKQFTVISSIFIFSVLNSIAQPNGGFENWSSIFGTQEPDNWQTFNFMAHTSPPNPMSAFKVTGVDKHSGNYALKLKTVFFNNNIFPGHVADTGCAVFTGNIVVSPFSFKYGFPYSGRPEKLEFWYKYTPVGNDTGGVIVCLRRWNGAGNDTIAFKGMDITAAAGYTLFQLNINYNSAELPDSAVIAFAPSKLPTTARQNSTLFIDDVVFTGWAGIDQYDKTADKVKIFPNPAGDNVTILAQMEEADNVLVIGASGKPAGVYKIHNHNAAINTEVFAEGFYSCEIRNKKNKILAKGKFNVVK